MVVSTRTADRSPKRLRAEATSATNVAAVRLQVGDVVQRLPTRVAAQIRDVVESKTYDGLTPVTITL